MINNWIEWLGYLASIVVAVSLTMTNIKRLRWINLAGSLAFTLYGWILQVYPVMIVNLFISGINIYYLIRIAKTKARFHLVPISWNTSIFLPRFVEFYLKDIHEHFDNISVETLKKYSSIFITRNVVPVGLFVYEPQDNGVIKIHLDYAIPMYRDFENARYFFREFRTIMQKEGYRTYTASSKNLKHQHYLKQMKFTEVQNQPGNFIRQV